MRLQDLLTPRAELCPSLRWKGQFVEAPRDPICADGICWCVFTQTCIGPDGKVADRDNCTNSSRECYGKGKL